MSIYGIEGERWKTEGFPINHPMFVGREDEIKKIEDFVGNSKSKFLCIYGFAGVGKTSLIYEFIRRNRQSLSNKLTIISAFSSIKYDDFSYDINSDSDIVVVDDVNDFHNTSMTMTTEYDIQPSLLLAKAKKIIFISRRKLDFSNTISDKIEYLELQSLSIQDIIDKRLNNINERLNNKSIINYIYEHFNGNTFLVTMALKYLDENQFYTAKDFLQFIQNPLKQTGLIDVNGNPLKNRQEVKIITNTLSVVNQSFIDKIHKNPNLMYEISPRQFEEFVAELLEREGFNVNLTKATRDGGKDIFIATKNNLGNFLYYVECKRYSSDNPVGVNLVRELYGTISADRATAGLLITSSYFTPDAISFTKNIQYQLSLKDFFDLKTWVNEVCRINKT